MVCSFGVVVDEFYSMRVLHDSGSVPKSVVAGGLMSYGPNPVENYRPAAVFVEKF
jgi:hypothetical protein